MYVEIKLLGTRNRVYMIYRYSDVCMVDVKREPVVKNETVVGPREKIYSRWFEFLVCKSCRWIIAPTRHIQNKMANKRYSSTVKRRDHELLGKFDLLLCITVRICYAHVFHNYRVVSVHGFVYRPNDLQAVRTTTLPIPLLSYIYALAARVSVVVVLL